jgi:hypothetical protein
LVIKNKIVVSVQVLDLDRLDNKDGTFFFAFKKLVFHIVVNIRKFLSVNYFNFIIIFKKAIKALVFQVIEKAFYLRFEIIGVELRKKEKKLFINKGKKISKNNSNYKIKKFLNKNFKI